MKGFQGRWPQLPDTQPCDCTRARMLLQQSCPFNPCLTLAPLWQGLLTDFRFMLFLAEPLSQNKKGGGEALNHYHMFMDITSAAAQLKRKSPPNRSAPLETKMIYFVISTSLTFRQE